MQTYPRRLIYNARRAGNERLATAGDEESILTEFYYRVPPMSVSIPNSTRRSGKLVLKVSHIASVSESRESETTRKEPSANYTPMSRLSMSRIQRVS